ncbi:MAG: energy-coupling factor transporter transmembrane protein EcfT [Clostridia bacterium]|nr:energy-coupling factor transporter transmembrane protein EcfT [Clostridia bacterium]
MQENIKFLDYLNPFYKSLTVMICALMLSLSYSVGLNLTVFALCLFMLLLFSKVKMLKVFKMLIPVIFLALGLLLTGIIYSEGNASGYAGSMGIAAISIGSMYNGLQLSTRVLAFAGLGLIFSVTTKPQQFVNSLQHQIGLSPKFAYGILAAFHLIPNMKQELENSRLALKARGVWVGPLSPKPIFSMFVNVIRWSEVLAMAMESKGFSSEGPRSYYQVTTVKWFDILFSFAMIGFLLLGILLFKY